jgi:hypothetical protein
VHTAFPGQARTFEQQTALQHRALERLIQLAFSSFRDGRMPMKKQAIATAQEAIVSEVMDLIAAA